MKRKSEFELEKVTLNLVKGDAAKLQVLFPRIGASGVIRQIVHAYLKVWAKRLPKAEEASDLEMEEIAQVLGDPSND